MRYARRQKHLNLEDVDLLACTQARAASSKKNIVVTDAFVELEDSYGGTSKSWWNGDEVSDEPCGSPALV